MNINSINVANKVRKYVRSDRFQNSFGSRGISIGAPNSSKYSAENLGWDIYEIWAWANAFVKFVGTRIAKEDIFDKNSDAYYSQTFKNVDPFQLITYKKNVTNVKMNACNRIASCVVRFNFNPELVRRPSLDPQKYPNGVDNIIRLLSNGWDGRRKPYITHFNVKGMWHGKMTRAWAYRRADNFLRTIINEWNNGGNLDGVSTKNHIKQGMIAVLDSSYAAAELNSYDSAIDRIRFGYRYKKRP